MNRAKSARTTTRPIAGRAPLPARAWLAPLLVALGSAVPQGVEAQSDWTVHVEASAVMTSMTGNLTFSEIETPTDVDLEELTTRKEGFTLGLEIWRGDWGLLTGLQLLEVEMESTTAINNVFTREVEETIGKVALARRLAPGAVVYAGVRTWNTSLMFELGPPTTASLDGSDAWVDPIVGGNLFFDFGEGWFAALDADIGGFGVSSDLTWNATGSAGYVVSNTLSMFVAYRALGVDYTTDAAAVGGTVTYDTVRRGPQIGLRLTF